MVNKQKVIALLPPFRNETVLIVDDQNTKDIIKEVLTTHERFETDYDNIYSLFDTGNIYSTGHGLWDFCKYNMQYRAESKDLQSTKSPAAILQPGVLVDCKHYSLFIGGVLDAIKSNVLEDWDWCYRFAAYDGSRDVGHVFVVVKVNGKEIWIDPVLSSYNEYYKPTKFIDKKPMALVRISGIGDTPKTITVDKTMAENNFLVMVNLNLWGLKTLLKNNPAVTNGPVQQYYINNGYDFSRLLNMLKY